MSKTTDSTKQWVSRSTLPTLKQSNSLVFGGDPAETLVSVSIEELNKLRNYSRATWSMAGLKANDRVLVSTVQDGGFPVARSGHRMTPTASASSDRAPSVGRAARRLGRVRRSDACASNEPDKPSPS